MSDLNSEPTTTPEIIDEEEDEIYVPQKAEAVKDHKPKSKDQFPLKKGLSIFITDEDKEKGLYYAEANKKGGWVPIDCVKIVGNAEDYKSDIKKAPKKKKIGLRILGKGSNKESKEAKEARAKEKEEQRRQLKEASKKAKEEKKAAKKERKTTLVTKKTTKKSSGPKVSPTPGSPTSDAVETEYDPKDERKSKLERALSLRPGEVELIARGVLKKQRTIPIFAVPLGHVMYTSYTDFEIPHVFSQALEFLRESDRLQLEGLFRISGGADEIKQFRDLYDQGKDVDFGNVNPHSVSGLLKLFFRELPDPLLTFKAYDAFCTAVTEGKDVDDSRRRMKLALGYLPPHNYMILEELLKLLKDVSQFSSINYMGHQNLGIVFGPTLLRKPQIDMGMSTAPASVVEFLLDEFEILFATKPEKPAKAPLPADKRPIRSATSNALPVRNRNPPPQISNKPSPAFERAPLNPVRPMGAAVPAFPQLPSFNPVPSVVPDVHATQETPAPQVVGPELTEPLGETAENTNKVDLSPDLVTPSPIHAPSSEETEPTYSMPSRAAPPTVPGRAAPPTVPCRAAPIPPTDG